MLNPRFALSLTVLILLSSCSTKTETVKPQRDRIEDIPAALPPVRAVLKPKIPHHQHTRVIPRKNKPKPQLKPRPKPRPKTFRLHVNPTQILTAHNRVRARLRLSPLTWSSSLSQYSTQWANQLKRSNGCQMRHRSNSNFGENLFWASPYRWSDGTTEIQKINSAFVVNEWAKEAKYYHYRSNSCQPGQQCGHYTQMVWKSSKKVGCGFAVCPDKSQVWVCSYDPPGNWQGQRPY